MKRSVSTISDELRRNLVKGSYDFKKAHHKAYVRRQEAKYQGMKIVGHEALLGVKIYFYHPYHSWEKGTIENTNKYMRRDIPKGSDISKYSKQFVRKLERKLNRRYMKVLQYRTPEEMLHGHRKRKKRREARRKRKR